MRKCGGPRVAHPWYSIYEYVRVFSQCRSMKLYEGAIVEENSLRNKGQGLKEKRLSDLMESA